MAAAVIASSPYDQDGLYQLSYNSYFWYGNKLQQYPVAAYSTMTNGVYPPRLQYSVDNQIASAQSDGNTLGGIFLDNTTSDFGNVENYRKSLWAYNNGPLSFSYRTGETVQYLGDAMADFTGALRSYLNDQGMILMASSNPGSYVWFSPNVDVIGSEVAGADNFDRTYARRTMSYGKIWTHLYVPRPDRPNPGQGPRLPPAGPAARLLPGLQRRLLGQLLPLRARPQPLQALHAADQDHRPGRLETRPLRHLVGCFDPARTLRQPGRRRLLRLRTKLRHQPHVRSTHARRRRTRHPRLHHGHRQGTAQQHHPLRHSQRYATSSSPRHSTQEKPPCTQSHWGERRHGRRPQRRGRPRPHRHGRRRPQRPGLPRPLRHALRHPQ